MVKSLTSTSRVGMRASRLHSLTAAGRPARFVLIFASCFLLGLGILLTPPAHKVDAKITRTLVKISHGLINICGGRVSIKGAVLCDPVSGFALEMKDGCNAVDVTILLLSAVFAFPAPWKLKALGFLAGTLILQSLNIVRFISLFYIGQYSMTWFDFAHGYLWQTLLILDTLVIFWLWANQVRRTGAVPHAGR